jgi:hypothetical protein
MSLRVGWSQDTTDHEISIIRRGIDPPDPVTGKDWIGWSNTKTEFPHASY